MCLSPAETEVVKQTVKKVLNASYSAKNLLNIVEFCFSFQMDLKWIIFLQIIEKVPFKTFFVLVLHSFEYFPAVSFESYMCLNDLFLNLFIYLSSDNFHSLKML